MLRRLPGTVDMGGQDPQVSDLNRALILKGKGFFEVCELLKLNGKSCVSLIRVDYPSLIVFSPFRSHSSLNRISVRVLTTSHLFYGTRYNELLI